MNFLAQNEEHEVEKCTPSFPHWPWNRTDSLIWTHKFDLLMELEWKLFT